jgi:hypothetical protein
MTVACGVPTIAPPTMISAVAANTTITKVLVEEPLQVSDL